MLTNHSELNLHEVFAELRKRGKTLEFKKTKTRMPYGFDVFEDGAPVFTGMCGDVWKWLRREKFISP